MKASASIIFTPNHKVGCDLGPMQKIVEILPPEPEPPAPVEATGEMTEAAKEEEHE